MIKIIGVASIVQKPTSTKYICRFTSYKNDTPQWEEETFNTQKEAGQFMLKVIGDSVNEKKNSPFIEIARNEFFSVELIEPSGNGTSIAYMHDDTDF